MLLSIIHLLFTTYTFILFARILGSWIPSFQGHAIMRFLSYYTEPYLKIFRRIIPTIGVFDLSPMVAFFALQIIEYFLLMVFR